MFVERAANQQSDSMKQQRDKVQAVMGECGTCVLFTFEIIGRPVPDAWHRNADFTVSVLSVQNWILQFCTSTQ